MYIYCIYVPMLRRIYLCNMIHNHRNMFISILPKKLYHPIQDDVKKFDFVFNA